MTICLMPCISQSFSVTLEGKNIGGPERGVHIVAAIMLQRILGNVRSGTLICPLRGT